MTFITKVNFIAAATLLLFVLMPAATQAKGNGKPPKGGVPMTTEDVKALFAGNTINWGDTQVFWNPDGTLIGIHKDKNGQSFGEGTWAVSYNELCYNSLWHGKDKKKSYPFNTCAAYYRVGKILWTVNTKDLPEYQGDVWTGFEKKMHKGDLAGAKAMGVKKKLGY